MHLPMQYLNPGVLRCSHFNGYSVDFPPVLSERTVNDYELEYYLRGDGGVIIDGTYVSFAAGDVNFRKPGQRVSGVPPYECYILCVDFLGNTKRSDEYVFGTPEEAQEVYDNILLNSLSDKLSLGKNEVVPGLMRNLFENRASVGDLAQFQEKASVYYLFQELFYQAQAGRQAGWTRTVNQAVREIRENFAESPGVEALVRGSGMSRAHFHARFLEETGTTPGKMITQCRIEQAKNLLVMTQMEIAEVGARCGYADAAYFSRIFKKTTGMTPGGFRERTGVQR